MDNPDLRPVWRSFWAVATLLGLLALADTVRVVIQRQVILLESQWLFVLAGLALLFAITVWLALIPERRLNAWLARLARILPVRGWKIVTLVYGPAGFILYVFLRTAVFADLLSRFLPAVCLVWLLLFPFWLGLGLGYRVRWLEAQATAVLTCGLGFVLLGLGLQVTNYPGTLGWSETNRFYYASLVFAGRLYGQQLPLSFLHPARYLLQAVPFLFDLPLWVHRAWQSSLWLILNGGAAVLAARRFFAGQTGRTWLAAGWLFLISMLCGVYYHLQVCVIVILLGVSNRHPWRSLIAVVLASAWAGMSRVNWFPVPAMLAIALYLLETPVRESWWRYFQRPLLYTAAGLGSAVLAQQLYILLSGNGSNRDAFGSQFTSDLLWYRLLPNATYAPGVLLSLLLFSAPLVLLLIWVLRGQMKRWHPLRWLGGLGMLMVLFFGGLLVSIKIGGGGDLHNMDAFVTLLALVTASLVSGHAAADDPGPQPQGLPVAWLSALLLIPVIFAWPQNAALPAVQDADRAYAEIAGLQTLLSRAVDRGQEVLFIDQRHLLTFGLIQDVPLIPEYELLTLTEMELSGNEAYMQRFHQDLDAHRFGAIILRRQKPAYSTPDRPFGDEDNTWIGRVILPLMKEYQPVVEFPELQLWLMVPRND